MKLKLLITICLAILFIKIHTQTPPTWGGSPRYTVNVKMVNDNPVGVWMFTYYYDSNLKAERYEHSAYQKDEMCLRPNTTFEKTGLQCHVTFATDGWSYIAYPFKQFCCKCTNSFGAIKYDWLKQNSTFVGIETIDGLSCTHWTKQGQYLNHYYSTVDKQLPMRFLQIKNGNPKSWGFDLSNYSTGPIDPSKLAPPPKCSNHCGGSCSKLISPETNLQTE